MMELILEEEKITPTLIRKMRDSEAWERELEQEKRKVQYNGAPTHW
jgi:hypothetical protein